MDTELMQLEEMQDKASVIQFYKRKIYAINNKIARINYTRKHYLSYKECLSDEPDKTFLEYMDELKSTYKEEIEYYRKKLSEV